MSFLPAAPTDDLLAAINSANPSLPVPVSAKNLYFGNPRLDSDGVTAILPTTAMLGDVYRGYVDFRYKRINLSKVFDTRPQLHAVGGSTLHAMLDVINRFLGLNFTTQDVVDVDVADVGSGEQVNIQIDAQPNSYGYEGTMVVRFFRIRPYMDHVVPNVELAVLNHKADPTIAKKDLDMQMWNIDFSNSLSTLKVTSGNYWANVPAVQALMAEEFGYTDWPAPAVKGVTDYATKDYPGANTKFQRVAVQKNVVGSTYQGNALFHYNLI
jgi:hypothetical protein